MRGLWRDILFDVLRAMREAWHVFMPSLSQKYRPQTFRDITGQTHVTETLRREVATGILGHAFLFSGPRGVGKTTTARVLAKALNCGAPQDGEPCNACAACEAANHGRMVDLIELDAATHTGVDMIREAIIEHARFAPMIGKRKAYVLDEAHMLSTSSWNALLKTLEEPPPYAFFILATTEWHKVPATIVSRCQRFAFRRIELGALADRVRELARREGWHIDDGVVQLIVSRADGCLRDAETLLGQIGSLGEQHLTMDAAGLVIPSSQIPRAVELMEQWADRNHAGSFAELHRFMDEGVALLTLMDDLIEVIRRLLPAQADPSFAKQWQEGSEEERAVASLIGRFSSPELHDLALMLFERRRDAKTGVDPLFALQLASTMVACGMLDRESKTITEQNIKISSHQQNKETTNQQSHDPQPTVIAPVSDALSSTFHASSFSLSDVLAKWPAVIRAADAQNHALPFILKMCRPVAVHHATVTIQFQYAFHQDKVCKDVKNRRVVEECLGRELGVPSVAIEGVLGTEEAHKEEQTKDIVGNILQAFGGSVVEG